MVLILAPHQDEDCNGYGRHEDEVFAESVKEASEEVGILSEYFLHASTP